MRQLISLVLRFALVWLIEGVSLLLADWLVPGIAIIPSHNTSSFSVVLSVALVLALMNVVVRPLLALLTLPLNVLTFGFGTLIINALILMLVGAVLPNFQVADFWSALLGALFLAAVNTILSSIVSLDDDDSFFANLTRELSKRQILKGEGEPGRGIVMLEIDGLSYDRIRKAVAKGVMPAVAEMLRDGTHVLSRYDCGLPSQTSSAQAGIMFGDNFDIPAFRWYDKRQRKAYVSNNLADAALLNRRYAHGHGLLRGGSSINNHMGGDAEKALLTMSLLMDQPGEMRRLRDEDFYLLTLNPYFFIRTAILTIVDVFVELYEAARQRLRNEWPRLNRLGKGYPILRAITNVFLREVSTYMVCIDIARGVPSIYTTYVGYDEVAHHSGPDSPDAMNTLRALDRQIKRIRETIQKRAGRPYELIVLSDHGQSFGATFKQRYGVTLGEHIQSLMKLEGEGEGDAAPTSPIYSGANDSGANQVSALLQELRHIEQVAAPPGAVRGNVRGAVRGRVQQATVKRSQRIINRQWEKSGLAEAQVAQVESTAPDDAEAPPPPLVVFGGGNQAGVYFNFQRERVTIRQLEARYPGLLDALTDHPGVGFVMVYDEDEPIVLGRGGARNLITGAVTGDDPLRPFGDPEMRAKQLLRVAQFPNSGDLVVNSPVYPDGTVAAYEELIGNHGGLGGEQTNAFIVHPADMLMTPTENAIDIFPMLNARRGLPGQPLQAYVVQEAEVDSWSRETLLAGIRDWRSWTGRFLRALRLDYTVFREVARDPFATGPALLIAIGFLIIAALTSILVLGNPSPGRIIGSVAFAAVTWLAAVALAYVSARFLGGQGRFTWTFRALAFALAPQFLMIFGLLPVIGGLIRLLVFVVGLIATWMALRQALGLRWLAAVAVPILAIILGIAVIVLSLSFIDGLIFTLQTLLSMFGIAPKP